MDFPQILHCWGSPNSGQCRGWWGPHTPSLSPRQCGQWLGFGCRSKDLLSLLHFGGKQGYSKPPREAPLKHTYAGSSPHLGPVPPSALCCPVSIPARGIAKLFWCIAPRTAHDHSQEPQPPDTGEEQGRILGHMELERELLYFGGFLET